MKLVRDALLIGLLTALLTLVAMAVFAQQPKPLTNLCRAMSVSAVRSPSTQAVVTARKDTAVIVLLCAPLAWWDSLFHTQERGKP